MKLTKQVKKEVKQMPEIAKKSIGLILVILGILGLFLPVLPGTLLIILGLIFLGNKKIAKYAMKLTKKKSKTKKYAFLLIRYLILLGSMFTLDWIYKVLTPLTVHSTAYLLKIFYPLSVNAEFIFLSDATIQIVAACVAGSAYLLLLILNLTIPMDFMKRIYAIIISFIILFALNVWRIFLLSVLLVNDFKFFDFTHKLFWYILSTIFVLLIWLLITRIFSIKEIPIYTDMKSIIKDIKK